MIRNPQSTIRNWLAPSPRWGLFAFFLLPFLSALALAQPASGERPMPLAAGEGLWADPGPEQSGPGAPKLLVVSPARNGGPTGARDLRYAGRVQPAAAAVTLNGEPLRVYPGGVFIGTRPFAGPRETWRFEALAAGKKTAVERTLFLLPEPLPAPAWPLAFFASPVSPSGPCWLPSGGALKVALYASPGRRAQARVGPNGKWIAMKEAKPDPDRGGVYTVTLSASKPLSTPKLQTVYFRISGSEGGRAASRELTSRLRVATLPDGKQLWGRVSANLGTLFKNGSPSDATRWGNWIRGTPFPVLEGQDERLRTGFGRGESGWVEAISIDLDKQFTRRTLPDLPQPAIALERNTLTLAWPAVKAPVACVFYNEPSASGTSLRVSLPGVHALAKFDKKLGRDGFIDATGFDKRGIAPFITIRLDRPVWGYAMACDSARGLRLIVRTRPPAGAPGKPLAGLRVMLDAGHGGPSSGAVGPSGLLEKEINLVQAAWLERDLEALGATVRQERRTDVDVDLDERVDNALAWNPDLFVSLHHNSVAESQDPLADAGPIVFYHYPHSAALAGSIAEAMASALAAGNGPRARVQVFRVNRNLSLCPSVLTETGFLCNPFDELKLRQTGEIKKSAAAIAQGIKAFFE